MRSGRYYLGQGYIFLLLWFLGTFAYIPLSTATDLHVLKDVRVLHQDGQWHVVLTGSESMIYKEKKTIKPLQLVLNLPNTVLRPDALPRNEENEIIGRITCSMSIDGPRLLTQIEIVLNRDISHTISRVQEKIWVSFDTPPLLSRAEPTPIEPVAKPMAQQPPVTKEVATPKPSPKKPTPLPPPLERKSLPSASKVLSVRQSKMDKELRYDIIVDGILADYVAFHLTNPPRVVVDLMGVKSTEVEKALNFDGPWVKGIRFGVHPSKVRVVFDLIPEAGLPYDIISEEGRLVVSFKPGTGFPTR